MNAIRAFYSFSGRIGRRGFWAGMITIFVLGSMLKVGTTPDVFSKDLFSTLKGNLSTMGIRDVIIYILMLYPMMALVTQRLHDRNKSGLLAILFWGPAVIQFATVLLPFLAGYMDTILWGYKLLAGWIGTVSAWFLIELGFFGPKEPNRYGPDPRDD